jgi:hypothetical protein
MDNRQDAQYRSPTPRRFVYRSATPDSTQAHPLRRANDTPHAFRGVSGQPSANTVLLKFRVYMKLN